MFFEDGSSFRDILFIEFKIVTLVTLAGKNHALDHPLDEIEKMVDASVFFRVNRQTLVSIHGIKNVENDYGRLNVYVTVGPQDYVSVSREKTVAFKHWLGQ